MTYVIALSGYLKLKCSLLLVLPILFYLIMICCIYSLLLSSLHVYNIVNLLCIRHKKYLH